MPITQSRMLSLLAAARDYQQALARVTDYIDQSINDISRGRKTPEQALNSILANSRPGLLLMHPTESPTVLQLETVHFTRERKRNERKAEKARENRMAQYLGVPKPNRGDGREFGRLGSAKSRQVLGAIAPDPTATSPASTGHRLDDVVPAVQPAVPQHKSTDAQQIQADSELAFEESGTDAAFAGAASPFYTPQVTEDQKTSVMDYLESLERKSK